MLVTVTKFNIGDCYKI